MENRLRRRCSVASNSEGYYAEYADKENDVSFEQKTPEKVAKEIDLKQSTGSRRSFRKAAPSKKYGEEFQTCSPGRKKSQSVNSENENQSVTLVQQKGNLFEDMTDIDGKLLFGFSTPRKRNSMAIKALNTPKSSHTAGSLPKTPTSNKKVREHQPKTPRAFRIQIKQEITKLVDRSSESEVDFSPDESDFEPSDLSYSETSVSSNESSTSEDRECGSERKPANLRSMALSKRSRNKSKKPHFEADYVPRTDGYFTNFANKKTVTSDHTLNRLKTPRLQHTQLFSLLKSMQISREHERCLQSLSATHKAQFMKWLHAFDEGFNILLYGMGSKRRLLQAFHSDILSKEPVIVVNGFFPSVTVKDILDAVINDILDVSVATSNLREMFDVINIEFAKLQHTHLFLIVHNIDGSMLRSHKAQEMLSRLVAVPNIHLIASIDHINTSLLWNHLNLSNFKFSWWDVTTLLPYEGETCFENSLLVRQSTDLALSSMSHVFQSLTTNARKIFMLIVSRQLKAKADSSNQEIAFKELYALSREEFLVSSDLALRTQLTEFLDHKLIKSRRAADGTEYLGIPIATNLLQHFFEENK